MRTISDYLNQAADELSQMEAGLRAALPNANLPDVIASGIGKLRQASGHQDAATNLSDIPPMGYKTPYPEQPEAPLDEKPQSAPPELPLSVEKPAWSPNAV